MSKQSIPTVQPQPNQYSYGPQFLKLFTEDLDREHYEARYGEQSEDWDESLPRKTWKDDSKRELDPLTPCGYMYHQIGTDGNLHEVPFTIPAHVAMRENHTGARHFPPYVVKPSFVTQGGFRIDDDFLSMKEDAIALAAEWGLQPGTVTEVIENQPFPYQYPADELRRVWMIDFSATQQLTAGVKIKDKNAKGIGVPYHWHMPEGTTQEPTPVFDFPPTGLTGPTHPTMPVPERPLAANEAPVTQGIFGGGWAIHRTDLAPATGTGAPPSNAGGLTSAQDKTLTHVSNTVNQILGILNPPA